MLIVMDTYIMGSVRVCIDAAEERRRHVLPSAFDERGASSRMLVYESRYIVDEARNED